MVAGLPHPSFDVGYQQAPLVPPFPGKFERNEDLYEDYLMGHQRLELARRQRAFRNVSDYISHLASFDRQTSSGDRPLSFPSRGSADVSDQLPIYAAVPCQSQDGSVAYSWVTVDSRTFPGGLSAGAPSVVEEQTYENCTATEPTYFTAETRLQSSATGMAAQNTNSDYANVDSLFREAQLVGDKGEKDLVRRSGALNGLLKNKQFATIEEEEEELLSCSNKVVNLFPMIH